MARKVTHAKNPFDYFCPYSPETHGSLDEYLSRQFDNVGVSCLFSGVTHFRMLLKEGYLVPGKTVIRMMYNVFRGDEHYLVIDADTLQGVTAGAHSGPSGRRAVKNVLDKKVEKLTLCFEARPLKDKRTGMLL